MPCRPADLPSRYGAACLTSNREPPAFAESRRESVFFFSSRRRHTRSVSAFLLNRSPIFDGHKAASDVRDEFVSVTEKLMDELAQCYNVLPQLDINNTIDHRPEGDEKWFLENEKTVTQFCRKLAAERHLKDIRDEYNYRSE